MMNEPTYYGPTNALNIIEYDKDGEKDTELFIVYDYDDELYYVYGHRGPINSKHYAYMHSFACTCALYEFISLTCNLKFNQSITIQVNQLDGLTSDSDYYNYKNKVSSRNEIVAYDNVENFTYKTFCKWLRAYL